MRTKLTIAAALCAAVALPVHAGAQVMPEPPDFTGTVTVAPKVTIKKLTKGLPVKVTCDPSCDASLTLAGPIGEITTKSISVGGTPKTFKLKAQKFQAKELSKGDKLSVTLNTGGMMSPAVAQDSTKVK